MTNVDTTTAHILIHGLVQGVGFRGWVWSMATERGLAGWVRNRADGSVEAVFEGPSIAVAEMVKLCEVGPRHAAVSRVEVVKGATPAQAGDFKVLPTP